MRGIDKRLIWRTVFVSVALVVLGFVFAHVSVMVLSLNAPEVALDNGIYLRVPIVLAVLGGAGYFVTELLLAAVRDRSKKPPKQGA